MSKPVHPPITEQLRNILVKLKGVRFREPDELPAFLKKENVRLAADDLIAFGHFLAPHFSGSSGWARFPGWLADVFANLIEGNLPKTMCDPWAGIGLLIGVLRAASKPNEAIAFTPNQGDRALGKVLF